VAAVVSRIGERRNESSVVAIIATPRKRRNRSYSTHTRGTSLPPRSGSAVWDRENSKKAPCGRSSSASSYQTSNKTVGLSGGQSVSITRSGKSLSVAKSGNAAKVVCASRPVKTPATAPPATAPPVTTPALTQQQKSAVAEAKQYLSTSAFSQQGLIDQLDSSAGSGYSVNDATAAVDSLTVDWNAEAVQAAKDYLKTSPFSCNDLIQQLDSSAGDQYTVAQATYGATQAGAR
jgi:hypothetical protein